MKTRMTATIAIAVVAMMVFAAAGVTTYSWFTDTEETDITITTGSLDVTTSDFFVDVPGDDDDYKSDVVPDNITVLYDDGRDAKTWYTDSNVLSIAGNPSNVGTTIGYTVTFSGDLDYRYLIDVDYPDGMDIEISVKDGEKDVEFGLWVVADSTPGEFKFTRTVTITINEVPSGLNEDHIEIINMITQYKNPYQNPLWHGDSSSSLKSTTLDIVPGGGTQTGTITINSATDFIYLNTLAKEWVSLYSNGSGTSVSNYRVNNGGLGTDYYYHWGWDIELATDLDMNNIPMDSVNISYWGSFDGNGHTISNVVLNEGQNGLFINGAKVINNLTVKNIVVNAPDVQTVGAVAGNGTCTNVHVINADVTGGKYTGGIIGKGSSFINCSVKDSTVTGTDKTVGGLAGYSIGDPAAATVTGNIVENVVVTGAYNVGGLLGQSQNETVDGNIVKNVTVKNTMNLPSDASKNEVLTDGLAARSNFDSTNIGINTIVDVITIDDTTGNRTIYAGVMKDVTIEGDDKSTLIFKTTADSIIENVTLKNVNFEYTGATADCGVVINSNAQIDNLVLEGCTFTGTGAKAGRGLSGLNNNATIVVKNCTFKDLGYPVYAWGGYKSLTIEDCTFENIKSWAVMPQSGFDGDLTVTGCTFNNCLGGGLIKAGTLTAGHTFTFTNNTITGCTIAGDHNWFQFNVSAGTSVISGNTMDGAAWIPGTIEGLK